MTIMSDRVSPTIEKPDVDRRPGSSDVEWAERAYRHQQATPAGRRHVRIPRVRNGLRMLVVALVVALLAIGLSLGLTSQDASSPAVVHGPTASHTVTAQQSTAPRSSITLPPALQPLPSLLPTLGTPKH